MLAHGFMMVYSQFPLSYRPFADSFFGRLSHRTDPRPSFLLHYIVFKSKRQQRCAILDP